MPRTWTALAVAIAGACALVACGSSAARLEGKWKGTKAEGALTEPQSAEANKFAKQMELEVKGNTITVAYATSRQSGHYTVRRADKSTVVIVTDKDGPSGVEETFTFIDDKTMKWEVLAGKTITFTKE